MLPLNRFKRLDVRGIIGAGGEPFPEIRKRMESLRPDEGLIVLAPFLPSPLIEFMGSQGFESKVERGQGADWVVYFWRRSD